MDRNQPIMHAREALHGAEGSAYVIIEGQRHLLMQLKKFEGKFTKDKTEIARLGTRVKGNRSGNVKGTWTATAYYNTDVLRKVMVRYAKYGEDIYFDIQTTNDDPNSQAGRHTVVYRDCNLDEMILSKIDIEAETLEEDVTGTFEDFEMPEEFKILEGMI